MTTVCPHCGTNNRLGSNFCNNCGTDLRDEEPKPPSTLDDDTSPNAVSQAARRAAEQMSSDWPSQETPDEGDQVDIRDEPLPPLFDLGLASPGGERDDELLATQPWLRPDEDEAQQGQEAGDGPVGDNSAAAGLRLVAGVQGLLDPLNLSSTASPTTPSSGQPLSTAIDLELTAEQSRRMRRMMRDEPVLAAQAAAPASSFPSLRIPWIFLLIGLAIALPVVGLLNAPAGEPQAWPGVGNAFRAIDSLPNGADVLVFFAYDPATAGEMDVVAAPILRHLLDQRSNLTFVSLNPNGPATVRRLIRRVLSDQMTPAERAIAIRRIAVRNYYLTGGAAVLPLLGQATTLPTGASPAGLTEFSEVDFRQKPDLAVVMAPRAEDVQHWLELVQPLNGTTVVAVTGAGVDPMVRPYLDSGQLRGLVSGFDGAETYDQLLGSAPSDREAMAIRMQKVAQNWGHFALLFVLFMGNLAAFYARGDRERNA